MKVLKEPTKTWNYKFSCIGCAAELEADENDILQKYYDGDIREPAYRKFFLKCPCCQEEYSLKETALPKLVLLKTKQNKL